MLEVHAEAVKFAFQTELYRRTTFMGVPVQKLPNDLWAMTEILWEFKPDLIIETGTFAGGSALYYATLLSQWGFGEVLSIDLEPQHPLPQHPRIHYLWGHSSTEEASVQVARCHARKHERVMVILDSDHSAAHVRAELALYAPLVSVGQLLIVEDTCVNGHPVPWEFGPGPMEALDDWLLTAPAFAADRRWEKAGSTFHPRGFWVRIE